MKFVPHRPAARRSVLGGMAGLLLALLAGCGGDVTHDPPGDNQQVAAPSVMDAGIVFGGASGAQFVPFSAKGGVPPIPANSDLAIRALIANDTFGQPIQRVWMTLPEAPEFMQTLSFQPGSSPDQAPYTYTTGTIQLPFTSGSHKVILHAVDSGNDEGTSEYTVTITPTANAE